MNQERIEAWIARLGSNVRRLEKRPGTEWALLFEHPPGSKTLVTVNAPIQPGGTTQLSIAHPFGPAQTANFDRLADQAKQQFLAELHLVLLAAEPDFAIQSGPTPQSCPRVIAVIKTHYDEGFSLDAFYQSARILYKTSMLAGACIIKYLGPEAPARPANVQ
jgi:hypothetical protein